MATKMHDMGVKRKDMYSSDMPVSPSGSKKDYDNEKEYPEVSLHGPHAEMMGAEDLKEGDVVEQTVRFRVKRHSKTTENGKTDYRMTLCIEKASDCKDCGEKEEKAEGDEDDGDGADDSPAMAYITGRGKSAE
jgi:hypothetical protein